MVACRRVASACGRVASWEGGRGVLLRGASRRVLCMGGVPGEHGCPSMGVLGVPRGMGVLEGMAVPRAWLSWVSWGAWLSLRRMAIPRPWVSWKDGVGRVSVAEGGDVRSLLLARDSRGGGDMHAPPPFERCPRRAYSGWVRARRAGVAGMEWRVAWGVRARSASAVARARWRLRMHARFGHVRRGGADDLFYVAGWRPNIRRSGAPLCWL